MVVLSNLEGGVLLVSVPPYKQPVPADFCPFQKDNLCTARDPRPLGCRIYFCDPNYQNTANRISEESIRRLKQLANEFEVDWQYAPLHTFLNAAEVEPCLPAASPNSTRISLPVNPD